MTDIHRIKSPDINDDFPIKESLSPPIISSPVYECAEAVYVTGFVPYATVRVFANVTDLLAEEIPPFGFAEIKLNRPVIRGESLTATQTVNNFTSLHSLQPVVVSRLPEGIVESTKPEVGKQLFECGVVVPVGNLIPGLRVHVTENGQEIGNEPVAQPWHPTFTKPLHANGKVSAIQLACEGTSHEIKSLPADDVIVQPAPVPVPVPHPDPNSMIPGNDTVTLTGLLVGAGVEIFDRGISVLAGWYANGSANYFPISQPLLPSSKISATQELCGKISEESDPVSPKGRLEAPVLVGPICARARFVVIRATMINAIVVVMRNGSIIGYGGAVPGDLILALGGNVSLNAGDNITVIQYIGQTVSPPSNTVTVAAHLGQAAVEVLGGDPFFLAKANEQPIDAPVFLRGRSPGPIIRVQACCTRNVHIQIFDPSGELVAEPEPIELFPGYYTATWSWSSFSEWIIPDGIPIGKYTVVVRTGCEQEDTFTPFYVIFNPADVGGSPRFSFDDTAVWFATSNNSIRGLHYFLHQSDSRVFSIAIAAASGETDSYNAAIAVARAEEQLFAYSLNYHTQDVVDLIVNFKDAQCADDACCLTALLRAIGIPAHPVTADAGLETGAANWTFDTWVEFMAPHGGSLEWLVLHPHEYPNMQPESRGIFGSTRGVATKGFNDVIVMANENWVMSLLDDGTNDVTYSRNACQEPEEHLIAATWIDELCEQGYWNVPHWDCAEISPRSFMPGTGFRFYEYELTFGGLLAGTVNVINRTNERRFGFLTVELISHLPESKNFIETSFGAVTAPATLDQGESLTVPFELRLPETLAPGRELFIWAHLDGRTVALHEVRIPPRLSCEVTSPAHFNVGDQVTIRAVITNNTQEPVRSIDVELRVPYALQTERISQHFDEIKPHETREVSWPVWAIAPLRSGSLHVILSSLTGGGIIVRRPFMVVESKPKTDAGPGLLLKK